ncbi:energy transducer TonB [Sphingomonas sp.]|uniref:energy transducer TonB n=1 Tax=Sphingomonas sp. TaxID=28214 RepID=UPI0035BC8F0D
MTTSRLDSGDRIVSALVSGGLVGLLLFALWLGLGVARGGTVADGLKMFGVVPPAPPPIEREPPKPVRNTRPAGEAAPPNLRSRPTELVAPEPIIVPPLPPPPVVAAPVAGPGADASAGAAEVPGPGTGAGGEGNGFGAGGDGDGDGAGDVPPRRIGGRIRDSDYPLEASQSGVSGTVGVRFVVDVDGRVPSCSVTRSSGSRLLDDTTCRLIVQRYRFRPARDVRGRPFRSVIVQNESWVIEEPEED